jgi:hypothetical protein
MASTRLEKTFTASNRKTFTISTWVKRGALTVNNTIYGAGTHDATDRDYLVFLADSGEEDKLYFNAKVSNSTVAQFYTNRRFRDLSAWYHIVLAFDTTQATDTNRMKLYVNGEQQTFQSVTYPSQNQDMNTNNTVHKIGATVGDGQYFNGSMTHFHFVDGTAYDASTFGETDATTGIWKPKTAPSVTYGTNGFFLKFENSGTMGTDSSPNGNNFTVNGSLTQTVDTPSNVFTTLNPLIPQGLAYANGNLSATHNAASWKTAYGTLAMSGTGKYYFESKVSTLGSYQGVGIVDAEQATSTAGKFVAQSRGYGYKTTGEKTNNDIDASYGGTYTTGDIIMTAVDLNAGAIWFGKNGTWLNSATQSEIEAGTTTNAAFTSISNSYVYYPAVQIYGSGTNQLNTGNGYFGTTPVSSAGSNGNGAIFEYDVPTGYYALNTKNINTYG